MAYSLNKVQLLGNLGKDPEVRSMSNGSKVTNFSIATTEKFTGKDGQAQEKTEWHNIVIFGKKAEIAEKYLKKGNKVYIEGKMTLNKWTDKDGSEKSVTVIELNDFRGELILLEPFNKENQSSAAQTQHTQAKNNSNTQTFNGGFDSPF
jgi:single-strand DNA-binding protein